MDIAGALCLSAKSILHHTADLFCQQLIFMLKTFDHGDQLFFAELIPFDIYSWLCAVHGHVIQDNKRQCNS